MTPLAAAQYMLDRLRREHDQGRGWLDYREIVSELEEIQLDLGDDYWDTLTDGEYVKPKVLQAFRVLAEGHAKWHPGYKAWRWSA